MVDVFRAAKPDMASGFSYGPAEIGEQQRQREAEDAEKWKAATGYRVKLRMDMRQFQSQGALTLQAETRAVRTGAPPRMAGFGGGQGTRLWINAIPYPGDIVEAEDTAARNPEIVKDPVFGAKKRFKPEPLAPPNHLGVLPRIRQHRRLSDLLPEIAGTYGVQIIADAYRTAPRVGGSLPSEPVALYALLDRLAAGTHRWENRGSMALVRSRTWFFDRPREIPLRFVRRWKELGDRYGLLPLEECIAMANTLPDIQLEPEALSAAATEAGLEFGSPYLLGRARNALRLYGTLTPAQRQALWQGKPIPVAQMTPHQREIFVAVLQDDARERGEPLDLRHLAGGKLSMKRLSRERTLVTSGAFARAQYETIKAPDNPPAGPPTGKRVTTRDGVTRYRMLTLLFRLEYGPGLSAGAQADVAL
jgi:hypothetical protein